MNPSINPEIWRKVLGHKLPGPSAHLIMAPEKRPLHIPPGDSNTAAVMILMYPLKGTTGLVFIKRNSYDGPHSAQVSFPGGAREKSDGSLQDTAIRETCEELGIHEHIEVVGSLSQLHIPVSNFLVTPYAGILENRPLFKPDPTEVEYLIECTLEDIQNPKCRSSEHWLLQGHRTLVPFFHIQGEKIWGATAMILSEFLQLAARLPAPRN